MRYIMIELSFENVYAHDAEWTKQWMQLYDYKSTSLYEVKFIRKLSNGIQIFGLDIEESDDLNQTFCIPETHPLFNYSPLYLLFTYKDSSFPRSGMYKISVSIRNELLKLLKTKR